MSRPDEKWQAVPDSRKLTDDTVPRPRSSGTLPATATGKASRYQKYLRSAHWKKRRQEIFARANGFCERCAQTPPRDVHHRNYLRLGQERDDDLMAVCRPCHYALERAAGNPRPWRPDPPTKARNRPRKARSPHHPKVTKRQKQHARTKARKVESEKRTRINRALLARVEDWTFRERVLQQWSTK